MIKRFFALLLSLTAAITALAVPSVTVGAEAATNTVSAYPFAIKQGENQSITVAVSGGLTPSQSYTIRLYRAYSGYESGMGSLGINFGAGAIGSAFNVRADSSGALVVRCTQHINNITNVGVYAYAVMDGWDTVARAFFAVSHIFTEKAYEAETNENGVSLSVETRPLKNDTPIALKIANGLTPNKNYRCRVYPAYDGYANGLGNTGVNYKGTFYDASGITTDSAGGFTALQTVHSKVTEAGLYAYTVMDSSNNWHTEARFFFRITENGSYIEGDVDSDGGVNVKDLIYMKKVLSGKRYGKADNDFNGDRAVDSLDMAALKSYLVGKNESLRNEGALSAVVPEDYKSMYGKEADNMRRSVLGARDTIVASGTTYYISPDGDDSNSGTSKTAPWKTLERLKLHKGSLKAGDAVLFQRGGIYRTISNVDLVSGVSYGAYGVGKKPCIYGSAKNYAESNWVKVGENLWQINDGPYENIGIIVFDYGKEIGYFRYSEDELKSNYDFCSGDGKITLYYDKNPAEAFSSIELSDTIRMFHMPSPSSDIVIENLCFKYTGGHAVRGANCSDVTVRGLEIGFVGGSVLEGFGDGKTRFGNGVEFMSDSQNILVENCWIYQMYDTGVTHQGSGNYHLKGFTVRNNLIEYCGMGSIEYWHTPDCQIQDVTYENNILRFAGYGFGGIQRPDKEMTGHIMSNTKPSIIVYNKATNFVIKNNVFELSTNQLVNAGSSAGTPPVLSSNTYIQYKNALLGYYEDNINRVFDENVSNTLKVDWKDTDAKVIFVE